MYNNDSLDYRTVQGYLRDNGELNYQVLWDDLAGVCGLNAQKRREKRYKEVMDAYERWIREGGENLIKFTKDSFDVVGTADNTGFRGDFPAIQPKSPVDWITYVKGHKGNDDWVIEAWGKRITFEEVAQLIIELYKNEDRIYPPRRLGGKYDGGDKLVKFLLECIINGAVTWKILRKHKLVPDF